ncbi:hypothetical protein PR202_ga11901 [Eleusine coracana subsp. coracana]|uniref:Uncharacterized protein n=1 Tax=Eleusine coracana subsp. coracana TaxID=191504 RepID=A0AAV5CA68_ELECO|nr:hypothetical protein PR202_ga11901 [Eleusine coracana subsp. coracana]
MSASRRCAVRVCACALGAGLAWPGHLGQFGLGPSPTSGPNQLWATASHGLDLAHRRPLYCAKAKWAGLLSAQKTDHAVNHVETGPEQNPEGAEGAIAEQEQNPGKPRWLSNVERARTQVVVEDREKRRCRRKVGNKESSKKTVATASCLLLVSIVVFSVITSLCHKVVAQERNVFLWPYGRSCSRTNIYTDGSQYKRNLDQLLAGMPAQPNANYWFYNGSNGVGADQVFAKLGDFGLVRLIDHLLARIPRRSPAQPGEWTQSAWPLAGLMLMNRTSKGSGSCSSRLQAAADRWWSLGKARSTACNGCGSPTMVERPFLTLRTHD